MLKINEFDSGREMLLKIVSNGIEKYGEDKANAYAMQALDSKQIQDLMNDCNNAGYLIPSAKTFLNTIQQMRFFMLKSNDVLVVTAAFFISVLDTKYKEMGVDLTDVRIKNWLIEVLKTYRQY